MAKKAVKKTTRSVRKLAPVTTRRRAQPQPQPLHADATCPTCHGPLVLISPAALPQGVVNASVPSTDAVDVMPRATMTMEAASPRAARVPGAPRGRRAENIFPAVKAIPGDVPPNVQHTFDFLMKHRKDGITLKALVKLLKMPYSTVQAQINKLVSMGAAKKQPVTLANAA
jgi:hypothetical protein